MRARGSTSASEAADIVLTTDRVGRLADAMEIAARARRTAVQSAAGGMAMSLAAMTAAGLHTVLRLHFAQEEESYFSLAPSLAP